jgi:hypothetical protein
MPSSRHAFARVFPALFSLGLMLGVSPIGAAQQPTDPSDKPPVLTSFSINASTDTVSASAPFVILVHGAVGTPPAEYRVSHRADFAGAAWTPYEATPIVRDWYDASGEVCSSKDAGAQSLATVKTSGIASVAEPRTGKRVTLYFQVRAALGEEIRVVNGQRRLQPSRAESNVLRATICALAPLARHP